MRAELRRPAGLLLAGPVAGVAAWALVSLGTSVRPWLVIALAVATAVVLAAVDLIVVQLPPPTLHRVVPRRMRTDREQGGLRRVTRTLDTALADTDRFATRLRPTLVRITEHRLRAHHSVDLRSDPDRARTLLGDSLWQLITVPPSRPPTRRQLADWVARLETL